MNRGLVIIIAACLLNGCASSSEQTGAGLFSERESSHDEWKWQRNEKERELREHPTRW
jgi:hypothetical protein